MASLTETVAEGDLRASLEALRDRLALEIETDPRCIKCGGSVSSPTAALAKQLRDVLVQLSAMAKPEGSKTDELKRKRAERQARVAKRSAGSKQRRAGGNRTSG